MAEEKDKLTRRRALLFNIRNALVSKQDDGEYQGDEMYPRHVEEDVDPFDPYYIPVGAILRPPFSFPNMYKIYEEGDVLAECVDAMIQNIDGFGYQLQYLGNDVDLQSDKQAQKELIRGTNFFDQVNENQSFTTLRKATRQDLEVIGNGAYEVIRNNFGIPTLMYPIPFRRLRLTKLDKKPVRVIEPFLRDGKEVQIPIRKYFRRFCQISATTGQKLRWFKEYGDPRILDAMTGSWVEKRSDARMVASEILHLKIPFGDSPYGIPRWIQTVLDVRGRRSSQYVNWDLFESQGIPPLAVLVTGGVLTDESLEEIETTIRSMRGTEKWNRIMILEANVESAGLEDKGTAKIELKPLAEHRKEDQMFTKYLDQSAEAIRHRFRLPPLYVGWASTFTHATSKSAKEVAEEQIFVPERSAFDEIVNINFMKDLNIKKWKFVSKGPMIVGAEEISAGVGAFNNVGAFSINHAVAMANTAFGLQMSKFQEPWGDYPFPLIVELLKAGNMLKGLNKVVEAPKAPDIGGLPAVGGAGRVEGAGQAETPVKRPKNVAPVKTSPKKAKKEEKIEEEEKDLQAIAETEKGGNEDAIDKAE